MILVSAMSFASTGSDAPLADAVEKQDKEAVAALLKHHADVNAPQPDGATALHWAVHWNDPDLVERLIHAGANVNAENDLGAAPLYLACRQANGSLAQQLLAAGAKPNSALPNGETALMTAAATGSVEAAKGLLDRGAQVNAQESFHGQTALMYMYLANQANGGLGSGKLSGTRGSTPAKAKAAEMPYTAHPGGGASRYFNPGAGGGMTGTGRYYNQRGRYFMNNGH